MQRTIVIGLGGTGLDVIRSLRRRIVENHGRVDALPYLRFLFIDTDKNAVEVTEGTRKDWEVLGQPTNLSPAECAIVGIEDPGAYLKNLSGYKQIEPWFPAENLEGIDQTAKKNPGASQIRPLGRMAFTINESEIRNKFLATLASLPNPPGGGNTRVVVVCSLSGGTGSGMFLDIAYGLKKWEPNIETLACLVLPSMTESRGPRYLANAYAALLELNYFSVPAVKQNGREKPIKFAMPLEREGDQGAPFDTCYLVSPRNSAPLNLTLAGLADMISHRLYLEFDSAAAQWTGSMMSNNRGERIKLLEDPFTGAVHSQNFCTFGLSSIEYPVEKVTEILAYQLIEDVVNGWVRKRLTPPNVNQLVREDLAELWLTDDHLLGNLDLFEGKNNYEPIEQQVRAYVNDARGKAPAKRLAPAMSERYNNFAKEFRTGGVIAFYQGLLDNARGAVEVLVGRLRAKINGYLLDPALGYDHAIAYVTELIAILEQASADYARKLQELKPKIENSGRAVNLSLNQLNEADNKIMFRDSAVSEAMQRVTEAMITNLTSFTSSHALNYGSQLLAGLLDGLLVKEVHVRGLKDFKVELEAWRQAIEKMHGEIRTELASRKEFLSKRVAASADFNGSLLFASPQVESIYHQLDQAGALQYIRERSVPGNDVLAVGAQASFVLEQGFLHAIRWLREVSAVRIAEKNVADQLLEAYPESRKSERHALLAANKKNSLAFLDFSQAEIGLGSGTEKLGYEQLETKQASIAALMSDDESRFPNVARVRTELEKEVGYRTVKAISDTHQILFLEEKAAFPLRLIKDLRALKEQYDRLREQSSSLPMHIQKTFDPPLMNLFVTSDEERRAVEEAEEDFLIGWVQGQIAFEKNLAEERDEVRYLYREAGAPKFFALGWTRDEAFDRWMDGKATPRKIRDLMRDDALHLRDGMDTMLKRKEFSNRLAASLEKIKQESRRKGEDPVYLRYSAIRERIFAAWKLPEPEVQILP